MVAGSSASETGKLLSHLGVRSFKTSLFFPLDKVCGECQVLHPLKDEIVNALYSLLEGVALSSVDLAPPKVITSPALFNFS
jgi:hypothetical protein